MSEEKREENKLHTKRYWIILGIIIATIFAAFLILDAMKYQSTDDAYVETTTVAVSPKVAGQIHSRCRTNESPRSRSHQKPRRKPSGSYKHR